MANKKELILHIGRAKSGTSTLQTYLTTQREPLAVQGVCYPKSGCGTAPAHHDLAHACLKDTPTSSAFRDMRAAFEAEVEPFDTIIVSSEAFQNLENANNLHFFFGRPPLRFLGWAFPLTERRSYRIRTLCYIREFIEFASSSYAQKVHESDYAESFAVYCRQNFRKPLSSLVELWRGFADEMSFVYYDRSILINQDIVADFFHRAGLTPPSPTSFHDSNPSISGNLLAFKLLLNRHGGHSMAMYDAFSEFARLDPKYGGKMFISDTLARHLRAGDYGYNEQLSRLVGPVAPRSFESENRFDHARWAEDIERFLEHPSLSHLRNRLEVYGATAMDVAALLHN